MLKNTELVLVVQRKIKGRRLQDNIILIRPYNLYNFDGMLTLISCLLSSLRFVSLVTLSLRDFCSDVSFSLSVSISASWLASRLE